MGSWVLSGTEIPGELIGEKEALPVNSFTLSFTDCALWPLRLMPPLTGDTLMGSCTSQGELRGPGNALTGIHNLVGTSSECC